MRGVFPSYYQTEIIEYIWGEVWNVGSWLTIVRFLLTSSLRRSIPRRINYISNVIPIWDFTDLEGPNGHKSVYPWPWLHHHSYEPKLETQPIVPLYPHHLRCWCRRKSLWGSEIAENQPTVDHAEIMNPETSHVGVGKLTKNIVSPSVLPHLISRTTGASHSSIMSLRHQKQPKTSSKEWPI